MKERLNAKPSAAGWLPRPSGFSEGILSQGQRIVWVTGQIGHDGSGPPGTRLRNAGTPWTGLRKS